MIVGPAWVVDLVGFAAGIVDSAEPAVGWVGSAEIVAGGGEESREET
jgi:hypothetical protein